MYKTLRRRKWTQPGKAVPQAASPRGTSRSIPECEHHLSQQCSQWETLVFHSINETWLLCLISWFLNLPRKHYCLYLNEEYQICWRCILQYWQYQPFLRLRKCIQKMFSSNFSKHWGFQINHEMLITPEYWTFDSRAIC